MASYSQFSANMSSDHLDTSYRPGGQHRRSHSEAAQDRNPVHGDDIALLDKSKHAMDDLYDPHTRSGRPSFAHSTPASPMLNPAIHVSTPDPSGFDLSESRGMGGSYRGGDSGWAKFLARFRFILIALTFVVSIMIVGVNAHILIVYKNNRAAGSFVNRVGTDAQVFWPAWPAEGIDFRPITSYVSLGSYNTLAALIFLLSSTRKTFRYLESGLTRLSIIIFMTVASMVLWILISVFLQFQAVGNSGKHSFRTWACSHTDKVLYNVDGINFSLLCTEANASRYGGVINAALNLLLLLTIIFSYRETRRSKRYQHISKTGKGWGIPKWGKA